MPGERPGCFWGAAWVFRGSGLGISGERPGYFWGAAWVFLGSGLGMSGVGGPDKRDLYEREICIFYFHFHWFHCPSEI